LRRWRPSEVCVALHGRTRADGKIKSGNADPGGICFAFHGARGAASRQEIGEGKQGPEIRDQRAEDEEKAESGKRKVERGRESRGKEGSDAGARAVGDDGGPGGRKSKNCWFLDECACGFLVFISTRGQSFPRNPQPRHPRHP
jgi:hypothetical protein